MTNVNLLQYTIDHGANAAFHFDKVSAAADRIERGPLAIGDLVTVIWNGVQFIVSAVRAGEGLVEMIMRLWKELTAVPQTVATPVPARVYFPQPQLVAVPRSY